MKAMNVCLNGKRRALLIVLFISILLSGAMTGCSPKENNVLTHNLSEPLNGAASASYVINTDSGHLTIDRLTTGEQVLASGTLQYLESQGLPAQSVTSSNGQATFTVKNGDTKQTGLRFPWEACGAATEWQIHLNPSLPSDITAHSGGGNVKLDFTGMAVNRVAADTGGGNMEVVLPDNTANLNAIAKTGGGNVIVDIGSGITGSSSIEANSGAGDVIIRVPDGIAARILATSGMGKIIVDQRFSKIDDKTYQSPDYDSAADKVEITVKSGAGNVTIETK